MPKGGAAMAVIDCGALHDYQSCLPILTALIKEVPVPPEPALCLPFDVPVDQMTSIVESILGKLSDVLATCKTSSTRVDVQRNKGLVVSHWRKRCVQREKYEVEMESEIRTGQHLVQEINLLQGERWRMEASQKKKEVEIAQAKEKAVEKFAAAQA